jgi:phosphoglycolate phosphatase
LPGLRENHPRLLDALNNYERNAVTSDGGEFYPGTIDGIIRLVNDYRVFLVSNCQEWYLDLFLHFSRLGSLFSGVDCYGMSGLPKGEMLLRMKRDHSLRNAAYVGDTASDGKAAILAGIAFVYAAWGFGKPEGKPNTVHSFPQFLDHIEGKADKNVATKRCGYQR